MRESFQRWPNNLATGLTVLFLCLSVFPTFCHGVSAKENQTVYLTCSTGKRIVIHSAEYRGAKSCTPGEAKAWVAKRCRKKNTCTFQVHNRYFGDPCFGHHKKLFVVYGCGNGE
ncbi:hypothetical protein ElyMa_006206200 [Elysia marginata]|uniref:SUEL-type lectin domain-containing protein n=1 Tax=Elysia marginata TaxID=1093978 RepID=A0AAV4H558_9GAST|nr:hypothetical protein ElyMa_006206200 [Elysia marginata]